MSPGPNLIKRGIQTIRRSLLILHHEPVEEAPHLPARILAQHRVQLGPVQIADVDHVGHFEGEARHVLGRDARHAAEHVVRGLVEGLIGGVFAGDEADLDGADGVRFLLLFFQLVEDFGGLVGRGGPDDLQAGEGEGEEDEFGLEVGWVAGGGEGRGVVCEGFEGEGFVLVEFDEEHWVFVVLEHCLHLVEKPAVLEGGY